MRTFAAIDVNGLPKYTVQPSDANQYVEGDVAGPYTLTECPHEITASELLVSWYYGGTWQILPPRPTGQHEWNLLSAAWVDPRTLDELKQGKWAAIKGIRDAQEATRFPYMSKHLQSDQRSCQRITTAVQSADAAQRANVPFSIEWTCEDDTTIMLDGPAMQGVPVALASHANTLHTKARQLRSQIEAATTAQEIDSITWDSA